jgi:hypothetical protein
MDFEKNNFDKIIIEKIIPLIQQEKKKFKHESSFFLLYLKSLKTTL